MFISVIIPIYNSELYLNNLLVSLSNQTLSKSKYEVILVDNNSTDNSPNIIKRYIEQNLNNMYYYFYNKIQSSYAARNFGISVANGDILAFTDADCIPDKKWLENIWIFYNEQKENKNLVIGGNIEIIINDKKNIWELYDKIVHLNNQRHINKGVIATANLVVSKKAFLKVGKFQEVKSGGDTEWSKRAASLNFQIKYIDNIKVYHPSRKDFSEIKTKTYRISYGKGQRLKLQKKSIISILLQYFLRIFYIYTNIKISIKLIRNIGFFRTLVFNVYFEYLRIIQLVGVYKGYRNLETKTVY